VSGPDAAGLAQAVLAAEPRAGEVRLVCIDGPSGSGKTTLAVRLAARLEPALGPVPVVHGDDVYEGWDVAAGAPDAVQAFGVLGDALVRDLVLPWARGEVGTCRTWDWPAGTWGAPRAVPPAPVVVLEGVGLAGAALRPYASLVVWLDADAAVRAARVAGRDGAEIGAHMDRWRAREDAWHSADRTAEHADVRIATG